MKILMNLVQMMIEFFNSDYTQLVTQEPRYLVIVWVIMVVINKKKKA
jgi:hypothetical protein